MAYNFLIAPDFSPERFVGWHLLNTFLQKRSDLHLHLHTPSSHAEQEEKLTSEDISLVYANPFDAAKMIREQGYKAIARPIGKLDEMVIASSAAGSFGSLDDLKKGTRIAMADNRDIKLVGMRLLEAVDLTEEDVQFEIVENYQAAARALLQDKADVAFFISEIYHSLSGLTKSRLNVLIESKIGVICHVVLVKDGFEHSKTLKDALLSLNQDSEGQAILKELGLEEGFDEMTEDEAEFMIDLMETLLD